MSFDFRTVQNTNGLHFFVDVNVEGEVVSQGACHVTDAMQRRLGSEDSCQVVQDEPTKFRTSAQCKMS
jgi:hypothetical protein